MVKKVLTLAVGAAGRVLDARADRGRFEQIKTQADRIWSSPTALPAAASPVSASTVAASPMSVRSSDRG